MKVLQINTVINSGSTGRIAEDIGNILISQGHESYIAFGRNNRESNSKKIKIGSNLDLAYHFLLTRFFDKHGFGSKNATRKFIHQINSLSPDLIHLHNIHGYYINIEILFNFLHKLNKPVVWTLHDCWAITGHCAYFDYVNCSKWQAECHSCPQKTRYPTSYLLDRSNENFKIKKALFNKLDNLTLVPVSEWLSDILESSFLSNYRKKIIYNGIDLTRFYPKSTLDIRKKLNLEKKKVILGVASIWEERKGLNDFIKLSKLLNDNYHILLVGLNTKQISKLPDNVKGIKRTESIEELANIYSLADVFFNPTWEDNFPTTNLEALACGTPIITYNTGGSPESIDKNTGFVVQKGDMKGVISAIEQIVKKGSVYYMEKCIVKAQFNYRKEDRFYDYIQLYEDLLN